MTMPQDTTNPLPQPRIHAAAADTLCIPGLKGRLPYTLPGLKLEYDPGFFKGNRLLHPELPVRQYGIAPEPLVQPRLHYDVILATLILCLAMTSVLLNSTRKFLYMRAKNFFYAASGSNESSQNDKDIPPTGTILATYLLLCITGSLFALHYYAQNTSDLSTCVIPLHGLTAVYAGCFAMMFLTKRMLSAFINWIFFDKGARRLWHLDYNFLLIAETVILLPVAAAGIYFDMPAKPTLLAGLAVVAVAKILLLYKAFAIFLPKFYCFLHLLSYLCGLEIMPFLALWVALHSVTDYLTITF